jgi:hypothetical protein
VHELADQRFGLEARTLAAKPQTTKTATAAAITGPRMPTRATTAVHHAHRHSYGLTYLERYLTGEQASNMAGVRPQRHRAAA